MSFVIYISHKSISPWLFSTSLHTDGKARGCRAVLEGREHTHVHRLPRCKPRQGFAWCQLLGPPAAVSSSTSSVSPGTSPALSPTNCSGKCQSNAHFRNAHFENAHFLPFSGFFSGLLPPAEAGGKSQDTQIYRRQAGGCSHAGLLAHKYNREPSWGR